MFYKIILDDIYPQCIAYNLTAEEAKNQVEQLRKEHPKCDFYVFTMDGDSIYW